MQKMTGERKMSTKAIREYFQPLEVWLKKENVRTGAEVGWDGADEDSLCEESEDSHGPRSLPSPLLTNLRGLTA